MMLLLSAVDIVRGVYAELPRCRRESCTVNGSCDVDVEGDTPGDRCL